MKCDNAEFLIIDYLDRKLDQDKCQELEEHLKNCPECRREKEAVSLLLEHIDTLKLEQPPEEIRSFFYKMLDEEQDALGNGEENRKVQASGNASTYSQKPVWIIWSMRIAAAAAIFMIGWISQLYLRILEDGQATTTADSTISSNPTNQPLGIPAITDSSQHANDGSRITTDISALFKNQPLASRRIQFISNMAYEQLNRDDYIAILFDRLNFDPNVNVRLTALHALSKHAELAQVKTGLFESLVIQNDPFMQVMLVDMLAMLKDDRLIPEMNRLIHDESTHQHVKKQIKKRMVDFL